VWEDMATGSAFLSSLFGEAAPAPAPLFLLYSFEGGRSGGRNTDGTVSLQSQLHAPAQAEAVRSFGFPEDHMSILRSRAVAQTLSALLVDAR
jgi:hypothetical protein